MILNIKNLGPLKKVELDISKKILFFVGFNNSGKTYLSQLIWGIYNRAFYDRFIENCDVNKILKTEEIARFEIKEDSLKTLLNEYSDFIKNNVHLIFKLEKKYFEKFQISLSLYEDIAKLIATDIKVDFNNAQDVEEKITIVSKKNKHTLDINLSKSTDKEDIKRRIVHFLFIGLFDAQSFYLPSTRGAYTTFYQYIYKIEKDKKDKLDDFFLSEEKDMAKFIAFMQENQPSYTMAMNELISKMVSLKQNSTINEEYEEFQNRIKTLIGGGINIVTSVSGKKELKLSIKGNIELPMYVASANSNQLTTLYLYFRHWISKTSRNFLVLDEPEENLHPKHQYKLLNTLMDFTEKGNKLLLTTHSTLIAKMINNYVTYSQLRDENKSKINSTHINTNIKKEDIEICFFDGEQVKHYDIEEYGVVFKDFLAIEDEIASLSNEINRELYKQGKS